METKFPLISYIVTAKYQTNKAGLRTLHRKAFNDFDFNKSREMAFEYFESSIETLLDEKEIFIRHQKVDLPVKRKDLPSIIRKCNHCHIIYRNVHDLDQGIKIYIRVNQNVMIGGQLIQENSVFLIQEFNRISIKTIREIEKNLIFETEFYKKFKQSGYEYHHFTRDDFGYKKVITTFFTYNCFDGTYGMKAFEKDLKTKIMLQTATEIEALIENPNPLKFEIFKHHDIELLGQTVCAFLNQNEIAYILLNYDLATHKEFQKGMMMAIDDQFIEEIPQVELFDFLTNEGENRVVIRIDAPHNFDKNRKISVKPTNRYEDYELYIRNRFGNVLVWED